MPIAKNGNTRIHYQTYGDKAEQESVVLLSGAGTDHTLWRFQIEALKEKHFVVAVDNRGSGRSDRPDGPYTADALVSDVLRVIDAEGLKSVNLVGFSLGGLIAQKFVSRHPDRVRRLVLMNCSLGAGNPDTVLPNREVINMFLLFAALTREDCGRNAVDYHFGKAFETEQPAAYRDFYEYVLENSLGLPAQIPVLVSAEAFIENFDAVKMPVMVMMSTDDPVTPPTNGEAFKKHLPHARIEYLDGYHASMLIHPGKVSALLAGFLSNY